MKKRLFALLIAVLFVFAFTACTTDSPLESNNAPDDQAPAGDAGSPDAGTDSPADGTVRIGVTFQSLAMPTFAEFSTIMMDYAPSEYGAEITVVSADWNANTQVSQIENFIESGVDAIIIAPVDPAAVQEVTARAQEKGIYIFSYAAHIDNYDAEYLVDDYNTGYACGAEAAAWINEHHDGVAEYGVLEYPINDQLISRAQGLQDAITELAPEATMVAIGKAVDANEGMQVTENMLQANPDMVVIVSIGDGGAIGANEVVKASGKATEGWGIFAVDATQEALQKIKDGEPFRCSMSLGGPETQGKYMVDTVMAMVRGDSFERDGRMPFLAINQENVEAYAESVNWVLD